MGLRCLLCFSLWDGEDSSVLRFMELRTSDQSDVIAVIELCEKFGVPNSNVNIILERRIGMLHLDNPSSCHHDLSSPRESRKGDRRPRKSLQKYAISRLFTVHCLISQCLRLATICADCNRIKHCSILINTLQPLVDSSSSLSNAFLREVWSNWP